MKQIVCLLFLSIILCGCSGDDAPSHAIQGKWAIKETILPEVVEVHDHRAECEKDFIHFTGSGFLLHVEHEQDCIEFKDNYGRYKVEGDVVHLVDLPYGDELTIVELTENSLKLQSTRNWGGQEETVISVYER